MRVSIILGVSEHVDVTPQTKSVPHKRVHVNRVAQKDHFSGNTHIFETNDPTCTKFVRYIVKFGNHTKLGPEVHAGSGRKFKDNQSQIHGGDSVNFDFIARERAAIDYLQESTSSKNWLNLGLW